MILDFLPKNVRVKRVPLGSSEELGCPRKKWAASAQDSCVM